GDLDRVERRTLAQVVAGEEERDAVGLSRPVGADPADEHLVLTGRAARGGEVLEANAWCGRQQLAHLLWRDRCDGLDPDRLGVSDHDRDPDTGRADGKLGQLENLARLGPKLR